MIERLRCLQRSSLTLLSQQQLVCYTTMKMFLLAPTAAVGGLVMCSTKFHQSCFCFTPTRATRRYEHSYQSNILFPRKMNLRHVWNGSRSNLSNLSMSFSSSSSDGNDKEHQTISMDEGSSESTCSGSADSDKPETFATSYHSPVMWKECIDALLDCSRSQIRQQHINEEGDYDNNGTAEVRKEEPLIFVDGTIGGGGHSAALLKQLQPGDIVLGCDVDPKALETASKRLKDYVIVESSHKDGNHQESSTTQTTARCHVDHPIFIPGEYTKKTTILLHEIPEHLYVCTLTCSLFTQLDFQFNRISVIYRKRWQQSSTLLQGNPFFDHKLIQVMTMTAV